jgi:hypothetical protein
MRAEAAVNKLWVEQVVDVDLPWTTKDYLTALFCRITHMCAVDRTLGLLPSDATTVFKCLWPGEDVPESTDLVAERLLHETSWQLSKWRHSSARVGADIALRFACSWYEGLDLDALHSMREDAPTNKDPAKADARRARAYQIASYASTNTFIPPPADLAEESSDEEEDEVAGEDEAEAPEEPAAGNTEQAPEAPEQAPKSSSPLYQ